MLLINVSLVFSQYISKLIQNSFLHLTKFIERFKYLQTFYIMLLFSQLNSSWIIDLSSQILRNSNYSYLLFCLSLIQLYLLPQTPGVLLGKSELNILLFINNYYSGETILTTNRNNFIPVKTLLLLKIIRK